MKLLILSLSLSTLILAPAVRASESPGPQWSFQASATAGAALIAEKDGQELLRLGCRRGEPAELFLMTPSMMDGSLRKVSINELELALQADSDEPVATVNLAPEQIAELRSLETIRLEIGEEELVFEAPNDDELLENLARSCETLMPKEAGGEIEWIFSIQDGAAFLGYGAYGSEFFGPGFRCQSSSAQIEVSLSVPEGAPRQIQLRSSGVEVAIPAEASPDILNGGDLLSGNLSSEHAFWDAFRQSQSVEVISEDNSAEQFAAPATADNVTRFLDQCGA